MGSAHLRGIKNVYDADVPQASEAGRHATVREGGTGGGRR